MTALQPILDAIGERLANIGALSVFAYVPDALSPPAAIVQLPRSIDFDLTYGRGADTYNVPVLVVVGRGDDRASHEALAAYLDAEGPWSVKAAVEGDSTLVGLVDDCRVTRADGVGAYSIGGIDYVGAIFTLAVVA